MGLDGEGVAGEGVLMVGVGNGLKVIQLEGLLRFLNPGVEVCL